MNRVILTVAAAALPLPALAAEAFVGVLAHDVDVQVAVGHYEEGEQVEIGLRSEPIAALAAVGAPRAYVFGSASTAGETSYAAAGLAWRWGSGGWYFQPGIGLAVHDGTADLPSPWDPGLTPAERTERQRRWREELNFGARVTFAPEISIGRRLGERWSAELTWVHLSHAMLAGDQNPGLDDIGVRIVRKLGR